MKRYRVFYKRQAMFLAIALLLCGILTSCKPSEPAVDGAESETSVETVLEELDLNQYKIIYSKNASESVQNAVLELKAAAADRGITLKTASDQSKESAYEILVGYSSREAAKKACETEAVGYSISLAEQKIVIAASSNVLISDAVTYFIEHCLAKAENGILKWTDSCAMVSDPYDTVDLVLHSVSDYSIIYPGWSSLEVEEKVVGIQNKIENVTGVRLSVLAVKNSAAYDAERKQILVGDFDFPEAYKAYSSYEKNEYGFCTVGNKIVIVGHSDYTLLLAIGLFTDAVGESACNHTDGSYSVRMCLNDAVRSTDSEYLLDIPAYTDGIEGSCAVLSGSDFLFIYNNTSFEAYTAYLTKLPEAGYRANGPVTQAGEIYGASYIGDSSALYVQYFSAESSVRIISSVDPSKELYPYEQTSYTRVTDTTVTLIALDYTAQISLGGDGKNGMSAVYTLADGSYLIYDGGWECDADALYAFLKEGADKNTNGEIRIAAWILTHPHPDHYYALLRSFAPKYGSTVTLNYLIGTPITSNLYSSEAIKGGQYVSGYPQNLATTANYFSNTTVLRAHAGQVMYFCDARVEILMTGEDMYPTLMRWSNQESIVSRVTVGETSVLMTADSELISVERLCKLHAGALKSDVIQVPHHGFNHSNTYATALYGYVQPSFALFTTGKNGFEEYRSGSSTVALLAYVGNNYYYADEGNHTVDLIHYVAQ